MLALAGISICLVIWCMSISVTQLAIETTAYIMSKLAIIANLEG